MNNISLDLSGKIDAISTDLLSTLDRIMKELDIDFFIAGAVARDMILEQGFGIPIGRRTEDFDLGVMVDGWDIYSELKNRFISTGLFVQERKVTHRLLFESVLPVDIIPFGAIESPVGSIAWPPNHDIKMNVLAFRDALEHALVVRVSAGLTVRIASLPAMVVLKLIAWNERHNEAPEKNVSDLALVLENYSQAGNENRLYEKHVEFLETEQFDISFSGARLLGYDMSRIMRLETNTEVLRILDKEADSEKNDTLIIALAGQLAGRDYKKALSLFKSLRLGLDYQRNE